MSTSAVADLPLRWARWWASASQARALANARAASVACSQARLERAEVEAYLAERFAAVADLDARVGAVSR